MKKFLKALNGSLELKIKSPAHETHDASITIILFFFFPSLYVKIQLHVIMKTEPSYTFQKEEGHH